MRPDLLAILAVLLAGGPGAASAGRSPGRAPLADLTGIWTNASYTRLQRPKALTALSVSPEEARAYEAGLARYNGVPADGDDIGQVASEFNDSGDGLARIGGTIRSSWIVDPPDGRLPYSAEGRRILEARRGRYDNPEDLDASLRCLYGNGSAPPQMSSMDTNLLQIVQTPTAVAIHSEKNHDWRVIRLGSRPREPEPPTWAGNSWGHFEGSSLVVETRGFRDPVVDRFFVVYTSAATVEERFTRTGPREILYEFTVTDPKVFTRPWRAQMLFRATDAPIYEFACHEGNYALRGILEAARLGRQEPDDPAAPTAAPAR